MVTRARLFCQRWSAFPAARNYPWSGDPRTQVALRCQAEVGLQGLDFALSQTVERGLENKRNGKARTLISLGARMGPGT